MLTLWQDPDYDAEVAAFYYLRVLENPHDELSWYRILQLLEGIGPRIAQRVMRQLGVDPFDGERAGTESRRRQG